ncbi:TPA: hypothetical protein R1718_001673, partial [Campylobacter lari]|nr:hypothetical protein [Campylobacter lari]
VVFNTEFLGLKNHNKQNVEFSRNIEVSNEIMPNVFNAVLNFSASEELSKKLSSLVMKKIILLKLSKKFQIVLPKKTIVKVEVIL